MTPLLGLTVRWSLADAAPDALETLKAYVRDSSHARFSAMDGLSYKTWRARPGEWFEGSYVFASDDARSAFQRDFAASAATASGTQIICSPPVLIEACEVVAVAEGASGFAPKAGYAEVGTQ